jgi:YVTN family beta-propeller protein
VVQSARRRCLKAGGRAVAALGASFAAVLAGGSRGVVAQPSTPKAAAPAPSTSGAIANAAPPESAPIFVLNSLDANVSVIDPQTHAEVRRIDTGREPHHLYLTPDEKSVIVANAASNSLTFIDPRTAEVQRTLRAIVDPYHLRFSPDMKWFVTAANRLNHVDVYRWQPERREEPLSLVKRLHAPRTPSHLMIDSRSTVAYVTLQDSDEMLALDLATQAVRWKVSVGRMPADIYLTADDRTLLVGLTGSDAVEAYDVSGAQPRLIKRIVTGQGAHAFRARGDRRHVFVSNRVANTISLIDTQTLTAVDRFNAPGGPDCMELLADGRTLLVTSRWARKLTYIDTQQRQVIRQVNVGRSPHGVWTLSHAPRI